LLAFNLILERIGRWHDAEQREPARHISTLRPHDLRYTFAFQLDKVTGADAYELERRLGHRFQRNIQRYTNPPEHIAANYVEDFLRKSVRGICNNMKQREGREPAEASFELQIPASAVLFLIQKKHDLNALCGRFYMYLG
jgi:hypothetical protein